MQMGVKDIFLFTDFVDFLLATRKNLVQNLDKKPSIEFLAFSLYLVKRKIRHW